VHELIVFVDFRSISFTREPGKTFLEHVQTQWLIGCDQDVDPQVELVTIDQQGVGHVPRNYRQLIDVYIVDVVDDRDALSLS